MPHLASSPLSLLAIGNTIGKRILILLTIHFLLAADGRAAPPPVGTRIASITKEEINPSDKLPLEELPTPDSGKDVLAIIFSGDGGWRDLDRDFGDLFQQKGIATVGFDCLKYFWEPRQPAKVASDLATILRYYLKAWGKKRVMLVGYSFGASWLPLLVNRLPTELQNQISLVVLLAPGQYTNVEIKMGDWISDIRRPGALDVTEPAAALRHPILCVYGTEEQDDSLCPKLKGINRRLMPVPGGHHFNNDYAPIENAILQYFE